MTNSIPLHHLIDLIDTLLKRPEPFMLDCFTNDKDKSIIRIESFNGDIEVIYHTHPNKVLEFNYKPWSESTFFRIEDSKFSKVPPYFIMPSDDVTFEFFNTIGIIQKITSSINYALTFNKNDRLAERMIDLTFRIEEQLGRPLPSHIWDLYK